MSAVTVLVPTVGRSAGLTRLLRALAVQEDPGVPWRILVVDNGAPSRAHEVVSSVRRSTTLPVDVEVVVEPRRGAAHARNRGVAEVDTPLVALLDDDVVPDPDWLVRVLAPLADPGVAAVGGTVLLDPDADRPRWLDDDLAGYLTHLELGPARDLGPGDYLLTANAAFRTEVLAAVGFDPRLGPRPGVQLTNDDLDLTRRTIAAGHRVVWQPDAVVVHDLPDERARLGWLVRRLVAQGRSDWLLDASTLRRGRAHGLGAAGRSALTAPRRWWGTVGGPSAWGVHVLADFAHAAGFAREAVAAWVVAPGREERP